MKKRSGRLSPGIAALLFITVLLSVLVRPPATAATPYVWKSVISGGGGFVPGILYHPSAPGLAYARTDMGGAYRWDNSLRRWVPLTDMMTRETSDYMGILSLALDPHDTNRVYMQCGKYTQSWAGTGALLSSTDKGSSWNIYPLQVKIGGNEDGRGAGERLQVDPNMGSVLFMGTTRDGLWKSTSSGASWVRVSSFSPTNVNFVVFDPSSGTFGTPTPRLFASAVNTSGQNLYRSDDAGLTWSPVAGQPSAVMAIRCAVADTVLYITFANSQGPNGATAGSVWRLNIAHGAWTNISPPTGSFGFSGVATYPRNPRMVIVSTLDCWWPRDEVYLSTDAGNSWTNRLGNATFDRSYAPYTSTINPHWCAALVMDPFDSSKAMFGTGYGIWATDDLTAGVPTWYFKDQDLEETVPMQIVSPAYTWVLSAMGDIDGFRHDDLDASPAKRFSPTKGTTLSIAYAERVPSRLVKTYNQAPYGAYSTDGGVTWRDFNGRGYTGYPAGTTAGGSWSIALSADASTIVWGPPGASMSYSTDNGKSWPQCGGVPLVPPVADRMNPLKFYAYDGPRGTMWVSTDGGKTFGMGATDLPAVPDYRTQDGNVSTMPGAEGRLLICCGEGGLYRSNNSGMSAAKVTSVTAAYRIGFGRPRNAAGSPAVYLHGVVAGDPGIFRSDDSGVSWTRINDTNHQFGWIHQISGDPRVYGRCYVSAEGRGILYGEPADSTIQATLPTSFTFYPQQGDSLRHRLQPLTVLWSKASDPQGKSLTYIMRYWGPGVDTTLACADTVATFAAGNIQPSSSYTFAGWVTNGTDTTASSNSVSLVSAAVLTGVETGVAPEPERFSLHQNFPNPFNPKTVVSSQLPVVSDVKLAVYDLLGREVAVLVNERRAAGSYRDLFDATGLASGVYTYRLTAGTFVQSRTMVLLK